MFSKCSDLYKPLTLSLFLNINFHSDEVTRHDNLSIIVNEKIPKYLPLVCYFSLE